MWNMERYDREVTSCERKSFGTTVIVLLQEETLASEEATIMSAIEEGVTNDKGSLLIRRKSICGNSGAEMARLLQQQIVEASIMADHVSLVLLSGFPSTNSEFEEVASEGIEIDGIIRLRMCAKKCRVSRKDGDIDDDARSNNGFDSSDVHEDAKELSMEDEEAASKEGTNDPNVRSSETDVDRKKSGVLDDGNDDEKNDNHHHRDDNVDDDDDNDSENDDDDDDDGDDDAASCESFAVDSKDIFAMSHFEKSAVIQVNSDDAYASLTVHTESMIKRKKDIDRTHCRGACDTDTRAEESRRCSLLITRKILKARARVKSCERKMLSTSSGEEEVESKTLAMTATVLRNDDDGSEETAQISRGEIHETSTKDAVARFDVKPAQSKMPIESRRSKPTGRFWESAIAGEIFPSKN